MPSSIFQGLFVDEDDEEDEEDDEDDGVLGFGGCAAELALEAFFGARVSAAERCTLWRRRCSLEHGPDFSHSLSHHFPILF